MTWNRWNVQVVLEMISEQVKKTSDLQAAETTLKNVLIYFLFLLFVIFGLRNRVFR